MEMNYPSSSSTTISHHHQSPPPTSVTISDPNNPYPTTFVQADTTSFKQVVQLLTGSSETLVKHANTSSSQPSKNPIHLTKTSPIKRPSKLYERRNSLKNFKISPLVSGSTRIISNPNNMPDILSPSLLDFPSLVLSPVTPLIPDPFNRSPVTDGSPPGLDVEAEEKAIAGKGFYLHPSPVTTPRSENDLQLLPLFPVTSPRFSGGSTSTS